MRANDVFRTILGFVGLTAAVSVTLSCLRILIPDSSRTYVRENNDIVPCHECRRSDRDTAGVIVVLTAFDAEYDAVRGLLREPVRRRHPAGTIFEVGRLDGVPGRIALAEIGTGNQAAAVIAERAITAFRPRAILFVGIAGALHDDLELGSVVVATKVYGYHGGTDETGGFQSRPQAWDADHVLDQLAREVHRTGSWTRLRRGTKGRPPAVRFRPVAAGEVVLNSQVTPLADQLRTTYSDAATIEMESAGTAKAAHLNRVPFLTVRGISDRADGNKYGAESIEWRAVAAGNAAAFAVTLARSVLAADTADRPLPRTPAQRPFRRSAVPISRTRPARNSTNTRIRR